MSDLENIISGQGEPAPANQSAVAENPAAAPSPVAPDPSRETVSTGQGQPDPDAPPKGFVPHKAIAEARAELRAMKEANARLQAQHDAMMGTVGRAFAPQQPAPPDWFQDPDAALRDRLSPIEQAFAQQREQMSQLMAEEKHGREAVSAAMQAIQDEVARNPAARFEVQRMMNSPHPYGALVDWHKQRNVLSEIGADPAAYREKVKAEILAEIQKTGVVPQASAAQPVMPSSFADQRNSGSRTGPGWAGPKPLQDIFATGNKAR